MQRTLAITSAAVVLALSGVAHGVWTDRWSDPVALKKAVAVVAAGLPLEVGPWRGRAIEADKRVLEVAGIAGSAMRRYVHRETGVEVSVLLVCGRPGPIATHPPEVCLAGAGYGLAGDPTTRSLGYGAAPKAAEFKAGEFQKPGPAGLSSLRVFWAWGADGRWTAPRFPRWAFASRPVLHKLYVIRPHAGESAGTEDDPGLALLGELLPRLEASLAPPR